MRALASHGFAAFALLLAAVGLARLAELAYARRLTRRARGRGEAPQPEPLFPAMVALHTMPFWMAPVEVVVLHRAFYPTLFLGCATTLAMLAALRMWTLRSLGDMWNVRIVRPGHVVTRGPYRWVRHPNYAIVIAELFVLPLAHTAWMTCLVVGVLNAVVLSRRIPAEERVLATIPGYVEAMGSKPRFVPRFQGRSCAVW